MTKRISNFCTGVIYAISAAMFLAVIWAWRASDGALRNIAMGLALAALVCAAFTAAVRLAGRRQMSVPVSWMALLLGLVCFGVKLAAVLRWRTLPESDYYTFYETARGLADTGTIPNSSYVALFPHIYGYSAFLSVFFRIFGSGPMVAPVVNAGLSAITASLLFLLVHRFGGSEAGTLAAVLWTACPSQTFFNIYVLSEPLYTAELAGVLLLTDSLRRRLKRCGGASAAGTLGMAAGLGSLLAAVQLARPIGTILLIALAGTLFVIDLPCEKRTALLRAAALLCAVLAFLAGTRLGRCRLDAALGEASSTSMGYSLAVGLNARSQGRWNAEDSRTLIELRKEEGADAQSTQEGMMALAKERLTAGNINFGALLKMKFRHLLSNDRVSVRAYGRNVFYRQELFSQCCDVFYLACVLLSALGAVRALVKQEKGLLLLAALYGVGLVCAQLLVEVAFRYHYSLYLTMLPLAAYGAGWLFGGPDGEGLFRRLFRRRASAADRGSAPPEETAG